jgi:hypothetical protein
MPVRTDLTRLKLGDLDGSLAEHEYEFPFALGRFK